MFIQPFIQGADQRKYQSSASLAFARGIPRWPVNSPHKGQVPRKMFPFDDVIMTVCVLNFLSGHKRYFHSQSFLCIVTPQVVYSSPHGFWDSVYKHGLTLIPVWGGNHDHCKMWGEISYPSPNVNGCTVEVWKWICNFIPHVIMYVIIHPRLD